MSSVTESLDVGNPNTLYKRFRKDHVLPNIFPAGSTEVSEEWNRTANRLDTGMYSPEGPVGTLLARKANNAIRYTPVLRSHDTFVYHKLVSVLESSLVGERQRDTFGNFHGGGVWRVEDEKNEGEVASRYLLTEQDIEKEQTLGEPEPEWEEMAYASSSLNKLQWVKDWKGYSRTLRCYSEGTPGITHAVIYDIANFYDSIELYRLQRLMRHTITSKQQLLCLEVLVHFLEHWNKGENLYSAASKGIPQDAAGEASRLLANFYLTPHDHALHLRTGMVGAQSARYSDDMILFARSQEDLRNLFTESSKLLHNSGLSINASKVRWMTISEFHNNWRFDITSTIESGDHENAFQELVKASRKRSKPERFDTLMKFLFSRHIKLLGTGKAQLTQRQGDWLIKYMSTPGVLEGLKTYSIGGVIDASENPFLKAKWILNQAKKSDYTRFQVETYGALRERMESLSDLVTDMRTYALSSNDPCLYLLTH